MASPFGSKRGRDARRAIGRLIVCAGPRVCGVRIRGGTQSPGWLILYLRVWAASSAYQACCEHTLRCGQVNSAAN